MRAAPSATCRSSPTDAHNPVPTPATMSLINEALKKAQKLRTGDPASLLESIPGSGSHVVKRGEPRSAQQLVLMAAAGIVLVVLSVVVTVWFVNRRPAAKPELKPVAVKSASGDATTPVIVPPVINPPVVAKEKQAPAAETAAPLPAVAEKSAKAATTPLPQAPAATLPPPAKVAEPPAPVVATPAPTPLATTPSGATAPVAPPTENPPASQMATAANAPTPPATDPRIHAFVDAVKVMGIRSSPSGDSRVLMNDRVFRLNDIVDRTLGVRLTQIEPDTLTFTDANGAVYTKNF